jgi:hypothetical protein
MKALTLVKLYHPNVTAVEDAKKNLSITVIAADCKSNGRKSPSACAMAKACTRQFDGAIISIATAYIIKGNKAIRYKVPNTVSREILAFDRNTNFEPGVYHLASPPKSQSLTRGAHAHRSKKPVKKNGVVREARHHTTDVRSL